jgi:hypothetical protein
MPTQVMEHTTEGIKIPIYFFIRFKLLCAVLVITFEVIFIKSITLLHLLQVDLCQKPSFLHLLTHKYGDKLLNELH